MNLEVLADEALYGYPPLCFTVQNYTQSRGGFCQLLSGPAPRSTAPGVGGWSALDMSYGVEESD